MRFAHFEFMNYELRFINYELRFVSGEFLIQNEQLKIGAADNSKLKTQNY